MRKFIALAIAIIITSPLSVFAYDNKVSHRDITDRSLRVAGENFKLEVYFIDNIGLDKGFDSIVQNHYLKESKVEVKVNGVRAYVYGNEWVANDVPLAAGANIINAVASAESYDNDVTASVAVNATGEAKPVLLVTSARSGVAPLEAYFLAATSPAIVNSITGYSIDFEGDGIVDYSGATFDDVGHIYPAEGFYYPTLTATDSSGNTYTDRLAIAVLPLADMDRHLRGIWDDMKDALLAGDIDGALHDVEPARRDRLRAELIALGTDLETLILSIEGLEIYSLYDGMAFGGLLRTESGTVYSYPIMFMTTEDGVWKIRGL